MNKGFVLVIHSLWLGFGQINTPVRFWTMGGGKWPKEIGVENTKYKNLVFRADKIAKHNYQMSTHSINSHKHVFRRFLHCWVCDDRCTVDMSNMLGSLLLISLFLIELHMNNGRYILFSRIQCSSS